MNLKIRLILVVILLISCQTMAQLQETGDYPAYSALPAVPKSPSEYRNQWDPFVVRNTATQTPLLVKSESDSKMRVIAGFDLLPWNGRQVVRDRNGTWYVVVSEDGKRIFLASSSAMTENPYRPRGGDLNTKEIVGGKDAFFPIAGSASRPSAAIDHENRLHVVWHQSNGLWHSSAWLDRGGLNPLADKILWSTPKQIVEKECRAGDILRDAKGQIGICYSMDDTVFYHSLSGATETVCDFRLGEFRSQRPIGKIPANQIECQDAVMDLAPDGSIFLAFRRDFSIWVSRRLPQGIWEAPSQVTREYVFHPSIMIVDGRPLITFQHEGLNRIPLDLRGNLLQRAGGGSSIGYAALTEDGWRLGVVAESKEIPVYRRGMWDKRGIGNIYAQIEQLGWPVLFKDSHGVASVLWLNQSSRWAFSARWMGDGFGEIQECRGPFNAPGLAVNAEKHALSGSTDVGLLFSAAAAGGENRLIFDRLVTPKLSILDDRQVLFLDSAEVAKTSHVDFHLNRMSKPIAVPAISPEGPHRAVMEPRVTKHGNIYVMRYQIRASLKQPETMQPGLAISDDGILFNKVSQLPEDLPDADRFDDSCLEYWKGHPDSRARPYYTNPDSSEPSKRLMRLGFSTDERGSYWLEYSPDAKNWTRVRDVGAAEALRERATPGFYDSLDPERPIRIYSRVYTETGRSYGVAWTKDLMHWVGLEHLLDPDHPYRLPPAESKIGNTGKSYTMRGQVILDSCAGQNEDEIYDASVRKTQGLYFCFYWPGKPGRPLADVGIAVSRDGFNFTRVKNGQRVLELGKPGAWDSGYIFQMFPLFDGESVKVYYRGTAASREGIDGFDHFLTEIGVASIRTHGWTYYSPQSSGIDGAVVTIPIDAPSTAHRGLTVNVEFGEDQDGNLGVEVLNADSLEPLNGYSLADCRLVKSGGLVNQISWKNGSILPVGQPLRLRFWLHGKHTKLYSFGFNALESHF